MRIVIVGAGQVGRHLCQQLSLEQHEVILIDLDAAHLRKIERDLNIMTVVGNGASATTLEQADISRAELFIAVTNIDEVNLISCILAQQYGSMIRVARVKNEDYMSILSPLSEHHLGIDFVINPDQAMAQEIIKTSELSDAFEVVDFAQGEVVVLGYHIKKDIPICNITLSKLKNLRGLYDFLIVAIIRNGKTIIPRGDDEIIMGDRIYLVAEKKDIRSIEDLLGFESKPPRRVFIIGGGRVGLIVAKALESRNVDVSLIEANPSRCEYLAEHLENTIILNFDGLDAKELVSEGIDMADLVIALTESDTTNILASLLAKFHGAKKCITKISRPDFIPLLGTLGIDMPLSPRLVAAKMILRFVRRGTILAVATLLVTEAEVVEFVVSKRWAYEGKSIQEAKFPYQTNIGAVVREGKVLIPSGNTIMLAGDRLVVFCMKQALSELEKFLSS
jgi:trk system potassium uptake protein TrkA